MTKYYKLYILWGVYFFTYFGMNFSLFEVSEILWLNVSLFGGVEMIGLGTAGIIAKKFSKVIMIRYCIGISSICCLLTLRLDDFPLLKIMAVLSKLKSSKIIFGIFLQPVDDPYPRRISHENQITRIWNLLHVWSVI